jgi:hypothetical protein
MTRLPFAVSLRVPIDSLPEIIAARCNLASVHQEWRAIMNRALSSQSRQPHGQRRSAADGAHDGAGARFATVLGRIAAGVLLVFLVVSAVVNARYGLVARQHALLTASSAASEDVAPVSNPV